MKRPSDELKEIIVERCLSGESITALANEYSISRGSIYNWLKKYKTQKKLRVNTGELRKLLSSLLRLIHHNNCFLLLLQRKPAGYGRFFLYFAEFCDIIENGLLYIFQSGGLSGGKSASFEHISGWDRVLSTGMCRWSIRDKFLANNGLLRISAGKFKELSSDICKKSGTPEGSRDRLRFRCATTAAKF